MNRLNLVALALLVAWLGGLVALAPAQINPGDYVVTLASSTGSSVVRLTPGGAINTLFSVPYSATAVTMAAWFMSL